MTDEERKHEGAEEAIEDLEAPAEVQADVAGGRDRCATPTCVGNTQVDVYCRLPTCGQTQQDCTALTSKLVVKEM